MKRLSLIVIPSLLALLASNAYADNLKVGILIMDEVLQKSPLAIAINDKISKDFRPRQDELNATQKKLQDDMDRLNYNSYKMSAADRNKIQATIAADKRDFDVLNASLQKDLAAAQAQYTQDLMGRLNAIIVKIAQDNKYDIIETNANILYLNNSVNITPQVIAQLK